jgi:hypothetical protein
LPAASFEIRLKGAVAVTVTEQEGAVTGAHATLFDESEINRRATVRVPVAGIALGLTNRRQNIYKGSRCTGVDIGMDKSAGR